jgi:hypothetical protein
LEPSERGGGGERQLRQEVGRLQLKDIGPMSNQKLTSILLGLFYEFDEEDVQLLCRQEVDGQSSILRLLDGMDSNINPSLNLIFNSIKTGSCIARTLEDGEMEDSCQLLDFGSNSRDGLLLKFNYFNQSIMGVDDVVKFFSNLIDLCIVIEAHICTKDAEREAEEVEDTGGSI